VVLVSAGEWFAASIVAAAMLAAGLVFAYFGPIA
jgi:hypothetical protein